MRFDQDRKIHQIRLHWDQASLLKDLDVIGARGKAWPIRSGQEQVHLITSSVHAAPKSEHAEPSRQRATVDPSTTINGGHKKMTRDPHTSLSLFEDSPPESNPVTPRAAIIPHRESAKPPPRDYHDLFVGNESDSSPLSASKGKSFSGGPRTAEEQIPAKIGAGKHYQPSRLFEGETSQGGAGAEETIKTNPKKYHHFDLAGAEDGTEQPKLFGASKAKPAKQTSHWDFEDFVTPQKPVQRLRSQDVRHFGWSDDEVNLDSPVKQKRTVQPRRDAETHFEFQDDSTPQEEKKAFHRQKGSAHNNGLGLYQNNLYNDKDETEESNKPNEEQTHQPLGNVTNINNHRKNFASQFTMMDDSPGSQENNNGPEKQKTVPADRRAAVKMMSSSWDTYDESPEQQQQQQSKENVMTKKKVAAGDGMGGRAGQHRQWGFGDDSNGEEDIQPQPTRGKSQPMKRMTSTGSGDGGGGGGGGRFWEF